MRVVGCFICYQGTFVLLRRHGTKPEPYTWGLPAGKVQPGEEDTQAAVREVFEETGIKKLPTQLREVTRISFNGPGGSGDFIGYRCDIDTPVDIQIDPNAHTEFVWVTGQDALQLPLITALDQIIHTLGYDKQV